MTVSPDDAELGADTAVDSAVDGDVAADADIDAESGVDAEPGENVAVDAEIGTDPAGTGLPTSEGPGFDQDGGTGYVVDDDLPGDDGSGGASGGAGDGT
ncbi:MULTISPECIES: hypothetical protein [Polymorphospora]|uniref:BatC protein n=1 Tax=Polymorphospora lycopeni TaxID=3140240 RepID=A0ABV5CYX0_9ACTN